MRFFKQNIGVFIIAVLTLASWAVSALAQDECPQPRVHVANDMDYYNQQRRSEAEHYELTMNTAVGNSIIAYNNGDIRFFSSFTAAVPSDEMDYYLTVASLKLPSGVQVYVKLVDNNNRVVMNSSREVMDSLWVEHTNDIASMIAKEVSPLISKIKDHQYRIRNTTMAAISSKFEPERRSYAVKVNEAKKITFILKDCDEVVLPNRKVILELEGKGKIDKTTCIVDGEGKGEFVYTAPEDNVQATVILAHQYEDVAGNDNRFSVDAVNINTSGKLWLLVNHVTERAEIYIVGEHLGELEMTWDSDNTRGGSIAAFTADKDKELWSSSLVEMIEMTVVPSGDNQWEASNSWFPGPTKITERQQGGYGIEILWPMEDGTSLPVNGTITFNKPAQFDQARKKYLAAKRGSR